MISKPLRLLLALLALSLCGIAQADIIQFAATLDGPSESPPVASPGTGTALVSYDSVSHMLTVEVTFSGLVGNTTVAHIHAPTATPGAGTAGVATFPGTFPGFPSGVTSGAYSGTWDLGLTTSYTSGFLAANGGTAAGAEAGLLAAMFGGRAYVNVHSSFAPGGEIRGFLAKVPDASTTVLLLGVALLALCGVRQRFGR